jgi:hypothetical protein
MENNIDASKGDRKANMDIKNAYTAFRLTLQNIQMVPSLHPS